MEQLLEAYLRWQAALAELEERVLRPGSGQRGAGILEYCLIIGLIAVAIVTVLNQFTGAISAVFTRVIGRLSGIG
jgi:Flp pilus assembly pilin Flp